MMNQGLPFLLLSDAQYETLHPALQPAKGTPDAIARGLLADKMTGYSPYWLGSPSGVKPDLVKIVSGNGFQDTSQSPSWTGCGARVLLPVTRAVCSQIELPAQTGKGYGETRYADWATVDLPFMEYQKPVLRPCLLAKVIFEPHRFDYGRGLKGKPLFEGSEIQARIQSPEFAAEYVDRSLYVILTRSAAPRAAKTPPAAPRFVKKPVPAAKAADPVPVVPTIDPGDEIDVSVVWRANNGNFEMTRLALNQILAQRLRDAARDPKAQSEIVALSARLNEELDGFKR
ncbi:hypothetical protein FACS1894211_15870 [Clostridia bacterium]|nr:hypothetical protein FACS1894211_15870 [Clostridia bacterium]